MSFTRPYGTMTAALLLSLGTAAVSLAQQAPGYSEGDSAGYVRITDRIPQPNGQGVQQAGGFRGHMSGSPCMDGSCPSNAGLASGFDPNGNCPTGNCPPGGSNGVGGYGTGGQYGNCPSGQCPYCRGGHCKFCEHYCKHSPGYGYTPPAKYPLLRRGVQYNTYFPAQWYGAGGEFVQSSAPMVYQPTDTTQLGFYYKHAPFWQPYPNPLPERPIPAQWHITPAPIRAYGNSYGYYGGYYGHGGHLFHHRRVRYYQDGYGMNGACPVDANGMPQGAVQSQPVQPNQVSPTPADAPPAQSPATLPPEPESSPQELPQTSLLPEPSAPVEGAGF